MEFHDESSNAGEDQDEVVAGMELPGPVHRNGGAANAFDHERGSGARQRRGGAADGSTCRQQERERENALEA